LVFPIIPVKNFIWWSSVRSSKSTVDKNMLWRKIVITQLFHWS
jgi:hypothetical protein